jgi:hypothetical protein
MFTAAPGEPDFIRQEKAKELPPHQLQWTARDSLMYNLGVGAQAHELPYVFEGHPRFQVGQIWNGSTMS